MPITVRDLLADPGLGLRAVTDGVGLDAPISWTASTELEDPSPFLSGAEVVLTVGLRQRTTAAQRRFVASLAAAGAVGLGFGTGLGHDAVPAATRAEAERTGLTVFEVPYAVPFLAITRRVAQAHADQASARLEGLLRDHQVLAHALLTGRGLPGLLTALAGMLGTDVALTQYGSVLHTAPGSRLPDESWTPVAISTGSADASTLAVRALPADADILAYAQGLVSLELSSQSRHRASLRQVRGQVLGDIVRGTVTGAEAASRIESVGLQPRRRHRVLALSLPQERGHGHDRLLAALPLPGPAADLVTAVLQETLLIIVPEGGARSGRDVAELIAAHVEAAGLSGRIGVGGAYPHPEGLRWSWFEARQALARGGRINDVEKLSLTGLLLASDDVPLGAMSDEVLAPVRASDAEHGTQLMVTLARYLDLNGSASAVAADLVLHRNTVRYRLAQIESLTGLDPGVTADRVQLWLALTVDRLRRGE